MIHVGLGPSSFHPRSIETRLTVPVVDWSSNRDEPTLMIAIFYTLFGCRKVTKRSLTTGTLDGRSNSGLKVGDNGKIFSVLLAVLVFAVLSVSAKALTIEHTVSFSIDILHSVVLQWTLTILAWVATLTIRHFRQVVLVKKLASTSLHAESTKPMTTHNRTKTRIVFGAGQLKFSLTSTRSSSTGVIVIVINLAKHGTGSLVWQWVLWFGHAMFAYVILKIVYRNVHGCHHCAVVYCLAGELNLIFAVEEW